MILYAAVGVPVLGFAQDSGAASVRSQRLFAAALEAKRSGDLPRALCLMQGAQRAWTKPAFSFNVAQLQRELGLCAEARANYQAFLDTERDAARRKQAELALSELAECTQRAVEPPAAASCAAWEAAAVGDTAGAKPATSSEGKAAPTPAEVARSHVAPVSAPLVAAPNRQATGGKRGVRQYLPWILAGVGVVCVALSGYELAQVVSAGHDVKQARDASQDKAAREEGRTANTFLWVFGTGATLSFGTALVLALTDGDDPPPSAAIQRN